MGKGGLKSLLLTGKIEDVGGQVLQGTANFKRSATLIRKGLDQVVEIDNGQEKLHMRIKSVLNSTLDEAGESQLQ